LWNASTGDELRTIKDNALGHEVSKLAFSPDGNRLAAHANEIKVWHVQSGHELLRIKDARDVAFSPDGSRLCGAAQNKEVKVWDSHSGAEVLSLLGHDGSVHFAVFSPDGKSAGQRFG
jgi:WD40 repeat protein